MATEPVDIGKEREIRSLASVVIERMQFMRRAGITFGGQRDLYEILGYDRIITNKMYRDRYARGGVAGRIVEALPKAAWRGTFELIEDEDPKVSTAFEKAWEEFADRVKLNALFQRANILARLSTYSVLLIGVKGEGSVNTELPKGKSLDDIIFLTPFAGGGGPGLTQNAGISDTSSSNYVDATIATFETDSKNPRFGLPATYQLRRLDVSSPQLMSPVHWSRVIHLAEGILDNEVYGQPALERPWNLLDDLDKVTGGGAEAFWIRANQGLHINVDKDLQLDEPQRKALSSQIEEYQHKMRRAIQTRGTEVDTLGSDTANFSGPADTILTQIAGCTSMPKRILTGSEMGELASSQDRDNWRDQVNGYQTSFCGPYAVQILVDRLIEYGYSPKPKTYEVKWPHIQVQTEAEKADGAQKWANTNRAMGTTVFTDDEIREHWYEMQPLAPAQKVPIAAPSRITENIKAPNNAPTLQAPRLEQLEDLTRVLEAAIDSNNTEVIDRIIGVRHAEHKFSSTQIQLPSDVAECLLQIGREVPYEDLNLEEGGREQDAHVTVKYGLHTDSSLLVQHMLKGYGSVSLTLGVLDIFEAEDYDVLFARVQSPELEELNKFISNNFEVTDTHPEYKPHATIAYLKKGLGAKYVGRSDVVGKTTTTDKLIFSSSDDVKTEIAL